MHSIYFKVYNLVPLVVSGLKGSFPQLHVSAPSLEISMYKCTDSKQDALDAREHNRASSVFHSEDRALYAIAMLLSWCVLPKSPVLSVQRPWSFVAFLPETNSSLIFMICGFLLGRLQWGSLWLKQWQMVLFGLLSQRSLSAGLDCPLLFFKTFPLFLLYFILDSSQ